MAVSDAPTSTDAATPVVSVAITSAEVDCAGTLHIVYDTTASPQPATDANHLVVVKPDDATTFDVIETTGKRPTPVTLTTTTAPIRRAATASSSSPCSTPADTDGPIAIGRADVQPAPDVKKKKKKRRMNETLNAHPTLHQVVVAAEQGPDDRAAVADLPYAFPSTSTQVGQPRRGQQPPPLRHLHTDLSRVGCHGSVEVAALACRWLRGGPGVRGARRRR